MEMKYYNPSNNFRAPIPREPKPYIPREQVEPERVFRRSEPEIPEPPEELPELTIGEGQKAVSLKKELNQDDLLILGLIFLLLMNSCEDYLLLFALGFLFLSGRSGK